MNDTARRHLRQTVATLVALSIVLSVLGPVGTVAADPSVSIDQTAGSDTVEPGETVTITTTLTAEDVNGPLVELDFPDGWEGTVTDSDGGAVNPQDDNGNVLSSNSPSIVWLSSGTYEVTTELQVPEDATPGEYTISTTGSGVDPTDDDSLANEDDEIDSTETTITVQDPDQNEDPTAAFTASPSSPDAGEGVSFDASGSSDADGSIASYEWDFGDGSTATGVSPSHTFDDAGEYDVTLTVTDDDGATATTTETVSVSEPEPANEPPTADAGADQTVDEGDAVTLDASDSSDADGSIASYSWTQTDGQSVDLSDADAAQPTFDAPAVDSDQQLTFEVDVTDDDGDTASDTVVVTVEAADEPPENQDPTADFSGPSNAETGESVSFDASASSDTDGSIASYEWDFGDGSTATGVSPSHTFDDAGEYDVTLTVTDDDGATATTTETVTVTAASDEPDNETPASTTMSLSPESELVAVGDTAEYDIVVDDVENGVGAYVLTVTVDDPSVASITDVELADVSDEDLTDVQIAEDGSSVTVEAVLVDTDDTGAVTVGTVTVESAGEGTTGVSLDVSELGDESGDPYEVTDTSGASLEASTLVVGESDSPAQDPDGDGDFEDINGDGTVDILDVQTLFADRDGEAVQNAPDAFDFNGDGEFTLLDIQALFAEETG
ncbi:PKD domain-containing protein [Halobaculum magnesiiphilum]|uniref:PKD domain-containing protein n=1 Tax=Halobaculum magnesiiphilum TaxID=1017351 RepID=A0A8T8WE50_9EURY|nr:PKD domain-containing protein [Halobaculum magnesiiphilum]QZP38111.1 PKD domain-containing protein [Halobaculum magnesiiphilum]